MVKIKILYYSAKTIVLVKINWSNKNSNNKRLKPRGAVVNYLQKKEKKIN